MTSYHPGRPTRGARAAALWTDRVWPVLAGALTAVGLIGAGHAYGPLGLGLVSAGLWVFLGMATYGLLSEYGVSTGRAVRIGLVATVVMVDLIGLMFLFPVAGSVAGAIVAVTSPPVLGRAEQLLQRAEAARPGRVKHRDRRDQSAVDRAFAQIVSQLETDPSRRIEDG